MALTSTVTQLQAEPEILAAVDLGSNSFHMIIARVTDGQLVVIDKLRETVRLASGLDDEKRLSSESIKRALECLGRFAQRLRGFSPGSVRAVGTNTLRLARNGEQFRRQAELALGHPVEVIAGREEARLVYLGVAHALARDQGRRLVVDIGGGSTEFIIGEQFETLHRESLYMGCVSSSREFFGDGRIDKKRMKRAELAARMELETIEERFGSHAWGEAAGSSGTIKAVAAVVHAAGWCEHGITADALSRLRRALIDGGDVRALSLPALRDDRKTVLPGGVAILSAAFEALRIKRMDVSMMALREGLLYDLLRRMRHEDVRERTVSRMRELHHVDQAQAERVKYTSLALFDEAAAAWGIGEEEYRKMLAWAASLHEIGLTVSHNQYHKHGGYLLEHADLAGFSRQEQALLASLVRGHRRKFPLAVFDALGATKRDAARELCVFLRLAVALHRGRHADTQPRLRLTAAKRSLQLSFPDHWLDAHPLTHADLAEEADFLRDAGFELSIK